MLLGEMGPGLVAGDDYFLRFVESPLLLWLTENDDGISSFLLPLHRVQLLLPRSVDLFMD